MAEKQRSERHLKASPAIPSHAWRSRSRLKYSCTACALSWRNLNLPAAISFKSPLRRDVRPSKSPAGKSSYVVVIDHWLAHLAGSARHDRHPTAECIQSRSGTPFSERGGAIDITF